MDTTPATVTAFFDDYAAALLDRDTTAIAGMYSVPSLIVFPGNLIAVTAKQQTEEFFASSWEQYEGVNNVDRTVEVIADGPGAIWTDVTWTYNGQPQERFCYQLTEADDGYTIAVLTPLAL